MGSVESTYIDLLKRLLKQRLLMHILFWTAETAFCFFVFRMRTIGETLYTNLGFLPGHMIFVYSLNYWLFPRYVLKGKFTQAFFGLLAILTVTMFYMRFADVYITHYSGAKTMWGRYNYPRVVYSLFSIGWIGVTIRLVKKWYVEKEVQHHLEKEKLTVELQLLRSQLHPHFLFNTLNSLYSMTLERSNDAPEAVLQLSSLLRYILYECNDPQVPLSREIQSLKDYIELEKMRFGHRLDISLNFTGDIANRTIAPLLFLPFVENSIKHGIAESLDNGWISLNLHVEEKSLHFKLINSREPGNTERPGNSERPGNTERSKPNALAIRTARSTPPTGGLGLVNVQRRLALLYPGTHTLRLVPEEDTYMVSLTLTSNAYAVSAS